MKHPLHLSRAAVLQGLAPVARAAGLDPVRLLARCGLPAAALDDPEMRIAAQDVLTLLEQAAEAAAMPDFGLAMADARSFATLGAVGLAMREQPDVRRALAWLIEYGWVQTEAVELRLEEADEVAILSVDVAAGLKGPAPQAIELTLASLAALLRSLLGPDWQPEMVLCRHPRQAPLGACLRHFGQVPFFGAEMNALVVSRTDYNRPIHGADPGAARELGRYLTMLAGNRQRSHADRVRMVIRQLLPQGRCRIDLVARSFGCDRRTLHRRLADEGTSFTRLVDEVRHEQVQAYLADGARSMTQLSALAGFSSLSAFSRWRRAKA